ncbi:MFS general substrate transporter [Aspergillus uvarum CBS 121591]|uniref:MFS general substrate transporter n=1 Tax=Aspergillus uvarum CBS 121591 TaxID=1448315 RepID=A0A319CRB4_9EURO|nr:MFS general substrate transporter [Aspergillus uvarum CBS 121591]PYH86731.1 MFS general substrate transporter [Aspergillus uvarum CBS 121591]
MSPMSDPHPHETTALLQDTPEEPIQAQDTAISPSSSSWVTLVVLLCGGAVLFDVANSLGSAAQTAITEDIVCKHCYSTAVSGLLDADSCTIEPIQIEIALITGWKDTFETIPGILLGVPFGMLADRYGDRPLVLLTLLGCTLIWFHDTLPPRAIWFSELFQILAGAADIFSYMTAVAMVSDIIAPPIGAALMSIDPWVPFLGASAVGVIAFLWRLGNDQSSTTWPAISRVRPFIKWLSRNGNVLLVVFGFFIALLGRQSFAVLLQYTSKRFHVSYAEASYFMPLRAGVSLLSLFLLLLLLLLPAVTYYLDRKCEWPTAVRDKRLTQINTLLMTLGSLAIFFAPTLPLLGLGTVIFSLGSSSLVTAGPYTVYTLIGVVSSTGMLIVGPLLAGMFHLRMVLGDVWVGLPFLVAAGFYALALAEIPAVRVGAEGRE